MEPRIGVYVCHCGSNIDGMVNVADVTRFAHGLGGVVAAGDIKFACSEQGQQLIKDEIRAMRLNRIVVASCSPAMHEKTFRHLCQEAGLNPYLLEMANIREQCSWVTDNEKEATEKAKALVAAAVRRVFYHQPLSDKEVKVNPNTLVIGGGIAGIQAALTIANAGHRVYLIERGPSIGGNMALLDKTFPTLDCSSCILTPKMSLVNSQPNIELMTYSEVVDVSGYVGNFKAKVKRKPRYVDIDKCTACDECTKICPAKIPVTFGSRQAEHRAIYRPFPQAVPNVPVIDADHCTYFIKGKCRACERVCEPNAIDFEQREETVELEIGAIIVATGFSLFNPDTIYRYGYGLLANIITSLDFERVVNSSGPTDGQILLADGTAPKSIGVIHCVGSRDKKYHEYCSRICCMLAIKFSHLLKEALPDADVYEFYTDIRSYGKGYEEFYNRVLEEGAIFIRGLPAEITEENGKLSVQFEDTLADRVRRLSLDMVVLACALEPQPDADAVARLVNISRSADGFFLESHPKLAPVATATEGVFIAGCCQSPKDIPDTVAQASAAAGEVLSIISQGRVGFEVATACVDESICSGCQACRMVCPSMAVSYDQSRRVCRVNEALCKGCGSCVAACTANAISLNHFTNEQIVAQMEGLLV